MRNDVWEKIVLIAPDLGISREALRKARERNRVPYKWRIPLLQRAVEKGITLAISDFAEAA